jgi:hypothetical protein
MCRSGTAIKAIEGKGQSGVLESRDYATLAVGGVRALRLLGRSGEAIKQGRNALQSLLKDQVHNSSDIAHANNTLRFEMALLNEGRAEAIQAARTFHQRWPQSLLLHADLVKILSITGGREEAASVLATMPACEYRRRLERELKKNEFLD